MKRLYLLLCGLMFSLLTLNAQIQVSFSENFDGATHTFTSNGWQLTTDYASSGTKSMRGDVPFHMGDSIVLTSPIYDFTNYGYVKLRFSHICKISSSDIAKIQYRVDAVGQIGAWKDIPFSSYKGNSSNYSLISFNTESYTEWQPADSLAIPDSLWWKEETFDLTNQISFEKAQIRFVLKKTANTATQIYYGWMIDSIELYASSYGTQPPYCVWESSFFDTIHYTGPYLIKAKVLTQTNASIIPPYLRYTASHPDSGMVIDSIQMVAYSGDSLWEAMIPQFVYGTTITYSITGMDGYGNSNTITQTFYSIADYSDKDSNAVNILGISNPLDSVVTRYHNNTLPIVVDIHNSGINNLVSCRLGWSLNGVIMDSNFLWTGNLLSDMTTFVNIGTYQSKENGKDTIEVWVDLPNGDTIANRFTFSKIVYTTILYYPHSVSILGVSSPKRIQLSGNSSLIKVIIQNKGYLPLDSCLISYTINNGTPVTTTWNGLINPLETIEVNLNQTYVAGNNQKDTICVWVSMPNGDKDSILNDDTTTAIISSLNTLNGRYVIGTSSLADFPDYNAFCSTLKQIGMTGHVVLAFEKGTYPSINISDINSFMTRNDTLTITSASGYAEDVVFEGTNSTYGINMGNNLNINIKRITSEYCIYFSASCDNIEISECIIDGVETLVNAYIPEILVYLRNYGIKKGTSAGIYVSINNMGNLRILNNVFRTVSTGIVLGTSMPNTHVTIKGNEITYSGLHGIYAIGSRIDFIDENKIIRNKNTLTDVYSSAGGGQIQPINIAHSVYGICLENVVIDSAISKNQCYSYGGAGGLYGEEGTRDMYFKNVNASVPYPAVVCNNEITRLFGGYTFSPSTTNYGIVLDGGNNMQIYHNTIYMNPSSNQYQSNNIALYGMNAQPENVVCKNNIFVSKDYPIDNLSSSVVLDHNNYYSLTNKSFTTNDRHALCVAPLFKDVTQSLEVLNAYYMSCLNVGIDKDITGKNRDSITTMGAYDEDVFVTSVTIEELSPIDTTISFPNMQIPVKVRVFNMGKNLLTSAVLGWSLNGVIQNNNLIWTGSLVSMASDTFQLGTYLPKMNGYDTICVWVSMPNHVLDSNTYDDTLILSIYGATDLEVDWVSRPQNIVYDVNPHIVEVYIHSISGMTNISNLYLHYYYTDSNNIVQKTDSVNMVNLGSELWRASLVNIPYRNNVYYRLSLTDYVGNIIVLADSFAIQQNFVRDSVLVAMADIVSPISTQGVSQGNYPIQVVIQNKGMNNLRTCKLGYTINGGTPIIYNWIGDLYTDFTDTVNIGTYNAIAGNNDILTVWVELPNGIIDSVTIDDTLSVNVVCCDSVFSGTYRIGNTILADFTDVNEFLRNASYCGINGSVTLLVDSGKYEGFDLSVLADVMTEYDTLVITSVRGDAADVVFESNNNVVNMGDNRNIYLLHITLISSAGSGINISSACHNVEINDCIINLNSYSNSSYVGIRFIGSTSNSYFGNLRVLNNTINGGYASCFFQYTNPDTIAMHSASSRITIKHNNFINWGYYGIYTTNNTKYDWIANNEFVSSANNSTQYGIYLYQFCQIDSGIVNNRILLNNTSTSYGMYIRQVNLEWKNSALIANNEIRKILGSGTFYGIYNTYSHVNYFHNSIFHSLPQTGYGFYTAKNIDPCIVKNNVFHVNTYPIYGTLANINTVQLDYNDYYSLTNHIGYAGSAKNTLLQWQNTILQDYNSLNIKPIYQDSSVNLEMVNAEDIIAPNVGINRDIADNKRYAKTSMGSYTQKVAEGMDLSLLGIIRPEELKDGVLCIPNKLHITCVVRNMRDSIIDFSVSPLRLRMEANGVTIQQYDTLINSGIMDVMQTDTIEVTNMFDVTHVGNYSLIATISCAADTIPNNDTAYLNFDIFRSELPIDESFANGMPNTIEVWESNVANAWTVVHDSNTNVQSQYGNSLLTFDGTRGAEAKLYVKYITLYNSYNPTLEFWYYHDTTGAIGKFADIMDVSYTIDGGESFEKLIQLRKNNGVDHGWKKYTVSLLPANGNTCVVVMFDAIRMSPSEYDGTQFIDRIKVFIGQDMAISEVYIDNINSCNMSSDVKVVIENMTNQVIDFETDSTSLQLDIDGINNQSFIYPLLMGNLASLEKDTITIASALDFSKGNHTIVAKIITPIDNVSANDTLIQTLVVNPNLNVVAQQITGGNQTVNCIVSGSQVNQVVTLENDGNMDMEDVIITLNVYDITGAKVQTIEDTLTGLFAVNQTTTHTFAEAYEVPADAMYNVEIVANPMCNASLTYTDVLTECVDQSDVEVTAFINPTDDETCSSVGTNIKVKVRVSNNHPDEDIQGVVLNVVVSSNNTQIASWTETLSDISSDSYIDFEFPQGFNVPEEADYTIVAYVNSIDTKAENDTLSMTKCTDLGMAEQEGNVVFLGQNIPNPATTQTVVNYQVPTEGTVVFTLTTVTGQVIYTTTQEVEAGRNSVEFNTENLAAGIYFYTMDFNGQRLTKKMTIKK